MEKRLTVFQEAEVFYLGLKAFICVKLLQFLHYYNLM